MSRPLLYLLEPLFRVLTRNIVLVHLLHVYDHVISATEGQPPKKYLMHMPTVICAASVAAIFVSAIAMRLIAVAPYICSGRASCLKILRPGYKTTQARISHISDSRGRYARAVRWKE